MIQWEKHYGPDVTVGFNPALISMTGDAGKKKFHMEQSQMGTVPVGGKFGHLTITREAPSVKNTAGSRLRVVECECVCGNLKLYAWNNVQSGSTKSCGCKRYKAPNQSRVKATPGTKRYCLELVREVPLSRTGEG